MDFAILVYQMPSLFSSSFFIGNRQKLQEQLDDGVPVVITAHGLLQRNGDSTFPFQQDSNFWYLTGLNEPDLILVMDQGDEYIMVPGRSVSREAFDGAVDYSEITKISGVTHVMSEEDGWQKLGRRLKKSGKVQTLPPPIAYIEQYGMYTNPARGRLIERLNSWGGELEILDIREPLVHLRCRKQPEEIAAIQRAIDATIDGLSAVTTADKLSKYRYEFEIENDLSVAFRTELTSGHAFAPIVASGNRAVTLHNVENSGRLHDGELLVLDVGAEADHYAADITRTVAVGSPSDRQIEVFETVKEIQKYALGLLKPGAFMKEYEEAVEKYMGEKLLGLGLISEASRDNIREFYPHATSHFLGLDVHDVGDYSQPLEAGMVLTCEPGIYIPAEGIGVRIEDDVLITADGNQVLSHKLRVRLNA